jgi:Tfp pilus assembly protein PilF
VRAGRPGEALTTLEAGQRLHPTSRLLLRLSALEQKQGKAAEAERLLQAWLPDHRDDATVALALAELHIGAHRDDEALAEFERLYAQIPDNAAVLNNLAWLYQRRHDPKARALAEKAFAQAPLPTIADTLGWILVSAGETATGLDYLKQAGTALPDDANVQYHLAAALTRSGQRAEARAVLERILPAKRAFDEQKDAEKLLAELRRG